MGMLVVYLLALFITVDVTYSWRKSKTPVNQPLRMPTRVWQSCNAFPLTSWTWSPVGNLLIIKANQDSFLLVILRRSGFPPVLWQLFSGFWMRSFQFHRRQTTERLWGSLLWSPFHSSSVSSWTGNHWSLWFLQQKNLPITKWVCVGGMPPAVLGPSVKMSLEQFWLKRKDGWSSRIPRWYHQTSSWQLRPFTNKTQTCAIFVNILYHFLNLFLFWFKSQRSHRDLRKGVVLLHCVTLPSPSEMLLPRVWWHNPIEVIKSNLLANHRWFYRKCLSCYLIVVLSQLFFWGRQLKTLVMWMRAEKCSP